MIISWGIAAATIVTMIITGHIHRKSIASLQRSVDLRDSELVLMTSDRDDWRRLAESSGSETLALYLVTGLKFERSVATATHRLAWSANDAIELQATLQAEGWKSSIWTHKFNVKTRSSAVKPKDDSVAPAESQALQAAVVTK